MLGKTIKKDGAYLNIKVEILYHEGNENILEILKHREIFLLLFLTFCSVEIKDQMRKANEKTFILSSH